jgi:hypothetical protein
MPPTQRLFQVLKDRSGWNVALADARRRAEDRPGDPSTAGRAA